MGSWGTWKTGTEYPTSVSYVPEGSRAGREPTDSLPPTDGDGGDGGFHFTAAH